VFSLFALSLVFSVALCVHVVRSGEPIYWIAIILFLQPLGGVVYLAAVVLPSLAGGTAARRIAAGARETLDPGREYRQARAACDESPTVHNRMRLARAAAAQGDFTQAEVLWAEAATGIHADDPAIVLGHAQALVELGRAGEALAQLDRLSDDPAGDGPGAILIRARALEGVGRATEADEAYRSAEGRLPGLEAIGRYAAFLARSGRRAEAAEAVAEMDRRIARANPRFRAEGRAWRDLAARALA
jgi:hypothetical protein